MWNILNDSRLMESKSIVFVLQLHVDLTKLKKNITS
jgi:hypothetical protein